MRKNNADLEKTIKQNIVDKIRSYSYYRARLNEVQEKLQTICCKTTATYGNLAPAFSKTFQSNVERIGSLRYELHKKQQEYGRKLIEIKTMIEKSGLDEREQELMWWLARNGNIQAFARRNHIGKDNVYKIKDRAIGKIASKICK